MACVWGSEKERDPWGQAGAQPKEATWDPLPVGSPPAVGAKGVEGWQPKARSLAVPSPAAEASCRDMKCHLSDGEGPGAGE